MTLNRLMLYLKARETYQDGPKRGQSSDLNPEMVDALHKSIGMREFSGVGVDDDFNLLYDKHNPKFFIEFHAEQNAPPDVEPTDEELDDLEDEDFDDEDED